jgi:hypothetical protein
MVRLSAVTGPGHDCYNFLCCCGDARWINKCVFEHRKEVCRSTLTHVVLSDRFLFSRLMPTLCLGSPCHAIDSSKNSLMVVTSSGQLYSWYIFIIAKRAYMSNVCSPGTQKHSHRISPRFRCQHFSVRLQIAQYSLLLSGPMALPSYTVQPAWRIHTNLCYRHGLN